MTNGWMQWLDLAAGDDSTFSLEQRLFNAITLLNGVINLGGAVLLGVQGQSWMVLLHVLTGVLFLVLYYLSRVRRFFRWLFWPFVLLILAFLWVNVLGNAGTRGGAHYYLIPALVIAVMLSQSLRRALAAGGLFAVAWISLLFVEVWRPEWITEYPGEQERLLDMGAQFLFVQLFTAVLFLLLVRNLNLERAKADRLLLNVQSIMESANDGIVTANSQGTVTSWNKAAERMFGKAEEEVLAQPLTVIIPDRYREPHRAGIRRMNETGVGRVLGQPVELTALRRDGSEFPIELSLSSWTLDGERFFSAIIRDITRRKEAEEELRRSREEVEAKAEQLAAANYEIQTKNEQLEGLAAKLAKYLSHQVYRSIFSGEKDVRIESYRKKLTVFFSDIKGFTDLTDHMEPEQLSSLLNSYLDEMARIAARHGGTIDKFIGDAIMIFFGDPESQGEKKDALACALMALEMRQRMEELQQKWASDWGLSRALQIRMGINTGFCTVGNFGSEERLDYTIIGGQVNLASRLESSAETDQILISGDTYSLIKDQVACEPKGQIRVKGIARPVDTYQIIDLREKIQAEQGRIREKFNGFTMDLDLSKINDSQISRATRVLRRALRHMESSGLGNLDLESDPE